MPAARESGLAIVNGRWTAVRCFASERSELLNLGLPGNAWWSRVRRGLAGNRADICVLAAGRLRTHIGGTRPADGSAPAGSGDLESPPGTIERPPRRPGSMASRPTLWGFRIWGFWTP